MNESVSNVFDGNPETIEERRKARATNQRTMLEWIKATLKDGVDYGKIHTVAGCQEPHCRKPEHLSKEVLLKPGAEKIQGYLGLVARFTILERTEAALLIKAQIYDQDGRLVGEGMGAREIRNGDDLNTTIKMAEKSAYIDSTLRVACLSDLFTQDLDTMTFKASPASRAKVRAPEAPASENATVQSETKAASKATSSEPDKLPAGGKTPDAGITAAQKAAIERLATELAIPEEKVQNRLVALFGDGMSVATLNRKQASEIIKALTEAKQKKAESAALTEAAPSAT